MDAPLDERHETALHYKWSSYGQIMGIRPCPSWLARTAVVKGWGRTLSEKRKAYRASIESRLLMDIVDPAEEAAARAVLGSERFVDRMSRGLNDLKENLEVRRESSQHRKLSSWAALEDVIAGVEKAYDSPREILLRRYNRGCEARQALLYLAATHCRGRYSLAELGEKLGPIGLAAVSNARRSMLRKMEDDPELKKRVLALSKRLRKRSIVSN